MSAQSMTPCATLLKKRPQNAFYGDTFTPSRFFILFHMEQTGITWHDNCTFHVRFNYPKLPHFISIWQNRQEV